MDDNNPDAKAILKHYGYNGDSTAQTIGLWPNDGTAIARLGQLPEALGLYKAEKSKIRVVFDYDPDYPRAVLQVWGLTPAALLPDIGNAQPRKRPDKC